MAFIIPALIGAAASVYGGKKASSESRKLRQQQQPLVDAQMQNLQTLQPYGGSFLQQGQQNLGMTQDYLRKLMSGDRNTTMSTLAPEINALTQQYQGSVGAQRGLYPRGGQSASQAAQLPYQMQGNINNLLFSARPQAAQQLGQLGGNQSSLGLSALGQGAGLANSMLNYGLNAQQQMFGQGAQIGQGISSLVSPFLQYYMMNRGFGTQGTTPQLPQGTDSYSSMGGFLNNVNNNPSYLTPGYGGYQATSPPLNSGSTYGAGG